MTTVSSRYHSLLCRAVLDADYEMKRLIFAAMMPSLSIEQIKEAETRRTRRSRGTAQALPAPAGGRPAQAGELITALIPHLAILVTWQR